MFQCICGEWVDVVHMECRGLISDEELQEYLSRQFARKHREDN